MKKKFLKQKILITGHTGFVGSWLYFFFKKKNFDVYGLSLLPKKNSLFNNLNLELNSKSKIINILNVKKLENYIKKIKPDIVIHLAAQSLVLDSFKNPLKTFHTNLSGTINILNIIKKFSFITTGIFFTTDKVYQNQNIIKKFKENDPLGGDDPYSASKAASEIAINSYVKSFYKKKKIIVLRCGNIIGIGDTGKNRIIPDIIESIKKKKFLQVRNPKSTRPWQHVLDIIFITLNILKKIYIEKKIYNIYNISPNSRAITVESIINAFKQYFTLETKNIKSKNKEKNYLQLNSNKIYKELKIKNKFSSREAIKKVVNSYKKIIKNKKKIKDILLEEIDNYERNTKNF